MPPISVTGLEGDGEIAVGLGVIAHEFGQFFQVDVVQHNAGGQFPGPLAFFFFLFSFLLMGLLLSADGHHQGGQVFAHPFLRKALAFAGAAQHFGWADLEFHFVAVDGCQPQMFFQLEKAVGSPLFEQAFPFDQRALVDV